VYVRPPHSWSVFGRDGSPPPVRPLTTWVPAATGIDVLACPVRPAGQASDLVSRAKRAVGIKVSGGAAPGPDGARRCDAEP
jgi:hypothetical protein